MQGFATARDRDPARRADDAEIDFEAEHDPARARRVSLAGLRRGAEVAGRVGVDPGAVTVAEDPALAAQGAHAVTRGDQIDFAPGAFEPGTERGDALLGHELAHVVQQRAGGDDASPGLEREADQVGLAVARGDHVAGTIHGRAASSTPLYSWSSIAPATEKPTKKTKAKAKDHASAGTSKINDKHYRLWGYAEDHDEIPHAFAGGLDQIVARVEKDPRATIFVQGHTGADEEPALGADRARAIELFLRARGLDKHTFVVGNSSAHDPLVDESHDGADAAQNRRVEVTIVPGSAHVGAVNEVKTPGIGPDPDEQVVHSVGRTKDAGDEAEDVGDAMVAHDPVLQEIWEGVKDADYMAGLGLGVLEGIYKAARDLLEGPEQLKKLIQKILAELLKLNFLFTVKDVVDDIADAIDGIGAIPSALRKAFEDFKDNWTRGSSYDVGHFRGKVVGYVALNLALLAIGAFEGAGGVLGELAEVLRMFDVGGEIQSFALKNAKTVWKTVNGEVKVASEVGEVGRAGAKVAAEVGDEAGDAAKVVPTEATVPAEHVEAPATPAKTAGNEPAARSGHDTIEDPAAAARAAKIKATLDAELERRGLNDEPTFADMDPQTTSKVNTALSGDPLAKATSGTQDAAEDWALDRANGNPREFANHYEFARAQFNEARIRRKGQANINQAASVDVTPDELTKAYDHHASRVQGDGVGQAIDKMSTDPEVVARTVQTLDRFAFESESSEVYHAVKHGRELPPEFETGDAVEDYAAATRDTIRSGKIVKATGVDGGAVLVIIRKEYQAANYDEVLEAIVYVEDTGKVTVASYGRAKAKI